MDKQRLLTRVCAAGSLCIAAGTGLADNRTFDGTGNNPGAPMWGSAGAPLLRGPSGAHYGDGIGQMIDRGGARAISNAVGAQGSAFGNSDRLSSMHWQWGQFIDHDFALVPEGGEHANIPVPQGDPYFDPGGTGTQTIPFERAEYQNGVTSPRTHHNDITHWIDGSQIYGSNQTRANALRTFSGGRLETSSGGLLPHNTDGLPNGLPGPEAFLAGDIRANEQVGLTTMHTLFVREHNHWANQLAAENPSWSDEQIFQRARRVVGAEVQAITYNEYLPALLGDAAPAPSEGSYDDAVNPQLRTAFSSAAFRVGHTQLNENLLRFDEHGNVPDGGHISLPEAFNNPDLLADNPDNVSMILRGLAGQEANSVDTRVVDGVRNMLFGPPGSGGLDLLAINLQRGRDLGAPDYNALRTDYGLAPVGSFSEITSDAQLAAALESLYGTVDNIDPWIGMMSEPHLEGAAVGETVAAVLSEQFTRLRDADRFFYSWDDDLSGMVSEIESTRLSDIILRNTDIASIQDNVFQIPAPSSLALLGLGGLIASRRRR